MSSVPALRTTDLIGRDAELEQLSSQLGIRASGGAVDQTVRAMLVAGDAGVGKTRVLMALRDKMDPRKVNGAVFLGLNGVVVKSHGSASIEGVANAVKVAARLVEDDITTRIAQDLEQISAKEVIEE